MRALTARELLVLEMLANGSTGKQIGRHLGVHESTVGTLSCSAVAKLEARTRTHAVVLAFQAGLITVQSIGDPS